MVNSSRAHIRQYKMWRENYVIAIPTYFKHLRSVKYTYRLYRNIVLGLKMAYKDEICRWW